MEDVFYNLHGTHAYDLETLVKENLIPDTEKNESGALVYCPNGGEFIWTAVPGSADRKILVCTYHGSTEVLTPFGNDFTSISKGLIDAIQKNFALKGKYGRNWGDFAYTDIGLNPKDWGWSKSVNHLRYVAGGSNVSIRPEDGYTISVVSATDPKNIKYLTAKLQWNITYDDLTKKWYYHRILPENEVNISTLKVYK